MRNIPKLFIHCGMVNANYVYIMDELLEMVEKSGMSNDIDLVISTVGTPVENHSWFEQEYNYSDVSKGEFHTLGFLKDYADSIDDNTPVGYVHTKGVFNGNDNPCISDWRKYMGYFVIEKMNDCINAVSSSYDVAGVDWHIKPNLHFSGGFWWSNTQYIKSLPQIDPPNFNVIDCPSPRHLAEFWIGANNPKVKCLHQSGINVYERHLHRYHESKYRSLDIT
jgi:hypothetical protein